MKSLKINLIMVAFDGDGNRIETKWEDIPENEREAIRAKVTDRFMAAAGYMRADARQKLYQKP